MTPEPITIRLLGPSQGKRRPRAFNAAILVALAFQHGVEPEVIRHPVMGPVAITLSFKFLVGK